MGAERTLVETAAPEVVAPRPAGLAPGLPLAAAHVISLQRTAGNQATIRALAGGRTLAPDRGFDRLAGGGVAEAGAPMEIRLPEKVAGEGKKAWKDSFPGGKAQEQGGILVKRGGKYTFRRGDEGTSGSFTPNYEDQKDGEQLIAVLHTHPYDEGDKGVSFSGEDLADIVDSGEQLTWLNAGTKEFVVSRTREFDAMVKGKKPEQVEKLKRDMIRRFNATLGKAPKGERFATSINRAVSDVCRTYHLVYYAGNPGGTLKRAGYIAKPRASAAEVDKALKAVGATKGGE